MVGRDNWRVVLPSLRGTLLQIGIGGLDRVLASLSIYMLLPASPDVSFATVLVVFVAATLLGIVSHAPGSVGVIEAAVLVGLPQYPREELLASLVTFRVLDFFLPLMLATAMFGARELRLLVRRTQRTQADASFYPLSQTRPEMPSANETRKTQCQCGCHRVLPTATLSRRALRAR